MGKSKIYLNMLKIPEPKKRYLLQAAHFKSALFSTFKGQIMVKYPLKWPI